MARVPPRKPPWLRQHLVPTGLLSGVEAVLEREGLCTVCREAACPNRPQCHASGTATFLLLGPVCTRACRFCNVSPGLPLPPDPGEPQRVARAVRSLGLRFAVLTMVSRDDLNDGGAEQVARTLAALRDVVPGVGLEVLVSDLGGEAGSLETVLRTGPEVLAHNLETVPRLYPLVRPAAGYRRSLEVLARAAAWPGGPVVKSGLMLGLGETRAEVLEVLGDLAGAGCRSLTLGQYLAPSGRHHPVDRYVPPEEFRDLAGEARRRGIPAVAAAPLVRSSYKAGELYEECRKALS